MKINLQLGTYGNRHQSYNLHGEVFLCFDSLSDFFDLSDKPKQITVVFSKKETRNSYYVIQIDFFLVKVILSDNSEEYYTVNRRFANAVGNGCWVSVLA